MRTVTDGYGRDSTAAAAAYLASTNKVRQANLYQIGETGDPTTIYVTNWDTPLLYAVIGLFQPAVVKNSSVTTKVGLDVGTVDITWTPYNRTFTPSVGTGSPLGLAQIGFYDNKPCYVWRVLMPTAGDAMTIGCYPLWGGRVANAQVDRGQIIFTINSFLDAFNQNVPATLIENTNIPASYAGAQPPPGFATIPQFSVIAGSTESSLLLNVKPPYAPGHIFATNVFQQGWVWFNYGGPLGGLWAIVANNMRDPTHTYNLVEVFGGFPWPPDPSLDSCFISAPFPVDQGDGSPYKGFPYVPNPQYGA